MTVLAEYEQRTPKSRKHFEAAAAVIPAGATRSLNSWPPHPVYLESGSGIVVTDVDGNTYATSSPTTPPCRWVTATRTSTGHWPTSSPGAQRTPSPARVRGTSRS